MNRIETILYGINQLKQRVGVEKIWDGKGIYAEAEKKGIQKIAYTCPITDPLTTVELNTLYLDGWKVITKQLDKKAKLAKYEIYPRTDTKN